MISFSSLVSVKHTDCEVGGMLFAIDGAPIVCLSFDDNGYIRCPYCGADGLYMYGGPGGWTWTTHECGTSTTNMGRTRLLGTTRPGPGCVMDEDII